MIIRILLFALFACYMVGLGQMVYTTSMAFNQSIPYALLGAYAISTVLIGYVLIFWKGV